MKNYTVRRYHSDDFLLWNAFIGTAKNATFLFHRDFMEYHADRFEDYSLMVFEGQKLVAVLLANRVGNEMHSHQGLSYGGIVINNEIRITDYLKVAENILVFLKESGISYLYVKSLPSIYHKTLAEEFDFLISVIQAENYRTDSYFVIDNQLKYNPNRNRKRALKIAGSNKISVKESNDFDIFWNEILLVNLQNRFGVLPVHTIDEINCLQKKFPENIRLFLTYQNKEIKAGAVIFLTENTAHIQYSSGTEDRDESGVLDFLFDFIIKKYSNKKFVSFGSSSENEGHNINSGLAYWKESFGAKCITQKYYKIDINRQVMISEFLKNSKKKI